jgi:hypothetical protein
MAVTARRAATAGGRASGRCFVSEFLDVLDDLLLALDDLTCLNSLGLRRLGISTGLEGSSVEGMAGVRIQGAWGGGRLQGDAASAGWGGVEMKLDFVEERLCVVREDLGGDEEYLKERGTSILKREESERDASGGNADDVDSYYQIGRVVLRTVQSRAGRVQVALISKDASWASTILSCKLSKQIRKGTRDEDGVCFTNREERQSIDRASGTAWGAASFGDR